MTEAEEAIFCFVLLCRCLWMREKFFLFCQLFCHHTEISTIWMCVAAEFFSLALLELIGVKIPHSHSQVIRNASRPCTHTGSWISIFIVRLIALLWLFKKSSRGYKSPYECTSTYGRDLFSSNGNEIAHLLLKVSCFIVSYLEIWWLLHKG